MHCTDALPAPKMRCKDAAGLQASQYCVRTMRLAMRRLWTVQKRRSCRKYSQLQRVIEKKIIKI